MTELNPYRMEPRKEGCHHCGHGEIYDVVLAIPGEEETELSESYGDGETADAVTDNMNVAFERGRKYQHDTSGAELLAATKWFIEQLTIGNLVRDITKDAQPDWSVNMMKFTMELQKAVSAVGKAEQSPVS